MNFKFLIIPLGFAHLLSQSLNAVQPFKFLEKDESPIGQYRVKFNCTTDVNVKKLQHLLNKRNIQEIKPLLPGTRTLEQEILMIYAPHRYAPQYHLPKNFPRDAEALIMHYFGLGEFLGYGNVKDWKPHSKGFGYISGSLQIGSQSIGRCEATLIENPDDFLHHFIGALNDIHHQGILKTCQKNPELIEVIDLILHGTKRQVQTHLTPKSAREVANLIASVFDGMIENADDPQSQAFELILSEELKNGVKISLTIRDKNTKPQDHKKWTRETRRAFQTFFHNSKISLTSDKKALKISSYK